MWNPSNPLRKDHPGHKLANVLFHNPWDDLEVHAGVFGVPGRMIAIPVDWAKVRELRQLALDEQMKGMDGFAKID